MIWLFVLLFISGISSTEAAKPPNIVFLISDDHSADDLGGNARTPAIDRLAASGVRFTNAYASSPQCSPSRASIVTGRSPHATGTSRLHATLSAEHDSVVDALRRGGYYVGAFRKVHLGEGFQSRWQFYGGNEEPYETFFRDRPPEKPFFLWIGFDDPHRPYKSGAVKPATDPATVRVPRFLPDTTAIRGDLADYYDEISRMDSEVEKILMLIDANSLSQNTLVVFAADNGMPFPGAKGSLYDHGVRVPLIASWPGHIAAGSVRNEIVSLLDLAPTWLEAANLPTLSRMEGKSLIPLFKNSAKSDRAVFFERNWHDNLDLIRGVRWSSYLLIQNYRPELAYPPTLDLASSPSWIAIQQLHDKGELPAELKTRYFGAPRPEKELYDLQADPFQLRNLANVPAHAATLNKLQQMLTDWMIVTSDFLPPPIPPKRGAHGEAIHP